MDIQERLTKVFRTVFDNESITLTPDLTADDVDEWDSLSHINRCSPLSSNLALNFHRARFKILAT